MSKYSSLLFNPDEFHEIGPFRFPIYRDLVPGEARGIETISKKQSRHTYASIKLAQRIAKDREISTKEAIELLGNIGDGNQDIFYDYAQELDELQQSSISAIDQKIAYVTLFMRYRGEVRLPKSKEWQKMEDWSDEDTEHMPHKLLDQVTEFIGWEQNGWPSTTGKDEEEETFSPPPSKH